MKLTFLASVAVVALAYATPGFAEVSETCMVGESIISCPAHSVPASHVDWKSARRLLAARAAHHHLHAAAHTPVRVALHPVAPASGAVRVASLEDRLAGVSCGGASASVLCPGYQLLGIAY